MNYAGWEKFSLVTQLANVGSEVVRAISWRKKGNTVYAQLAFYRALELIDRTIAQPLLYAQLKELTRLRSALVDDFAGENTFGSTDEAWHRYFYAFNIKANLS